MIKASFRFFDVAALTDATFQGIYHGKTRHPCDRVQVLERARAVGCDKFLVAAGSLPDFKTGKALLQEGVYLTAGVHPCRASEVKDPDLYFQQLEAEIESCPKGGLVAVGECGLDYDRLDYASKEQQLSIFPRHFSLAARHKLPLYLHNRNTGTDFYQLMRAHKDCYTAGVLHSFTGPLHQLKQALDLGLFIGLNGCSLKTEDNLAVVRQVPLQRLLLETDSPYCEIRKSHAGYSFVDSRPQALKPPEKAAGGMVKGRNEPARILEVFEAVARIKQVQKGVLAEHAYLNALRLFGL